MVKKVFFGNDCLLAWNITVLDGDGHIIIRKHSKMHEKSIYIGNHVWICPNSVILKGAKVGDGSIIATNTLITKEIKDNDVLVGFTNTILEVRSDLEGLEMKGIILAGGFRYIEYQGQPPMWST